MLGPRFASDVECLFRISSDVVFLYEHGGYIGWMPCWAVIDVLWSVRSGVFEGRALFCGRIQLMLLLIILACDLGWGSIPSSVTLRTYSDRHVSFGTRQVSGVNCHDFVCLPRTANGTNKTNTQAPSGLARLPSPWRSKQRR